MTTDLPVAISVAGWILTFLTALVVTGAVVPYGALARRTAARWWFVPPAVTLVASAVSAAILQDWVSRVLCGAAAMLACAVFLVARPLQREVSQPRRHGPAWSDSSASRRLAMVATAVVTYTVGIYVAMRSLG